MLRAYFSRGLFFLLSVAIFATLTFSPVHAAEVKTLSGILSTLESLLTRLIAAVGAIEPSSRLVASYSFDEGSGISVADSSGNGNTGTLTNGPTWTIGKYANALSFDGANDYVTARSQAVLDDLSSVTFSAWINPSTTTYGAQGTVAMKGHGAPGLFYEGWVAGFYTSNPTVLQFEVAFSGGNLVKRAAPSSFTTNEWQHLAVVWDGTVNASGVKIYRNGVEVGYTLQQNGIGSRINDSARDFIFGSNSYNDNPFKGIIDDVRLYSRVLTQSEIQSDMNTQVGSGGTPTPTPSPTPSPTPTPKLTLSGSTLNI